MTTKEPETTLDSRIKGMLEQALITSQNVAALGATDTPDEKMLAAVTDAFESPPSADFIDLYLGLAHGLHEAAEIARKRGAEADSVKYHAMAQRFLRDGIQGFGYALAHYATKPSAKH